MLELWLVFALISVVAKTGYYATQKQRVGDESAIRLVFIPAVYGALLYAPIAGWYFSQNDVSVSSAVIGVIVVGSFIETLATILFVNILDEVDIGIATTIKGSSVVFVALFEPLVLSAEYSIPILLGAILTVIGLAITSSENMDGGLLSTRLSSSLTFRASVILAFILFTYVALALISRFGNSNVPSVVYGGLYFPLLAFWALLPLAYSGDVPALRDFTKYRNLKLGGWGVGRSAIWGAFALASASAVTVTSRLVIPAQIIVGTYYFKEQNGWRRLVGGAIVVLGAALAILY